MFVFKVCLSGLVSAPSFSVCCGSLPTSPAVLPHQLGALQVSLALTLSAEVVSDPTG